mmetsp:Transcript_88030/g.174696  ORF Transcript_88030/g.174696 Transcript_88030/m.174696 type:complete len:369 (-) Transcript_88030:127-1233(-)
MVLTTTELWLLHSRHLEGVKSQPLMQHLVTPCDSGTIEEFAEIVVPQPQQRQWCAFFLDQIIAKTMGQLDSRAWGTMEHVTMPRPPNFTDIVVCVPSILFLIIDFVADMSLDAAQLSFLTANSIHAETFIMANCIWSTLYERRWPAFHDAISYSSQEEVMDWCAQYQETLVGKTTITLEVYHRERRQEFAMSVMPANVRFEAASNAYVAEYISASKTHPEAIPAKDAHRLRFCPPCTRECLEPLVAARPQVQDKETASYPYRVLQGTEGLIPGQSVELQWKMQQGSPFGWWYATLEAITHETSGMQATATITFGHFPEHSRWHRLKVCFGDAEIRPCHFGGFTGGIRACSVADTKHWSQHFSHSLVPS